jgi:PPM family protein phosphatase
MRLRAYAAKTHQGPYLQINEDGYEFDFDNDLFMIFDGFGGSGIGDRAVDKLKQDIKTYYTQISRDLNATMPIYHNPRNLLEGNAILNAMIHAHQNLLQANQQRPLNQRAGSSGLMAVRSESIAVLVGVGSCRAYHFRQGKLATVISEDTMGFLSKEQHGSRFHITPMSAFGMYPELTYQMREVRLQEGDKILALTDGVYSVLEEDQLLYVLNRPAPDAQERVNALLKLSNSRGNVDNQTAMILEF